MLVPLLLLISRLIYWWGLRISQFSVQLRDSRELLWIWNVPGFSLNRESLKIPTIFHFRNVWISLILYSCFISEDPGSEFRIHKKVQILKFYFKKFTYTNFIAGSNLLIQNKSLWRKKTYIEAIRAGNCSVRYSLSRWLDLYIHCGHLDFYFENLLRKLSFHIFIS